MIEFAAVALTLGAITYHNLHADFLILGIIALILAFLLSLFFQSKKGIVFSLVLGIVFMFGALAVWNSAQVVSREVYGDRTFEAKLVSVDRRLTSTNLFVKDSLFDERIQLFLYEKSELLPGDIVQVSGYIELPESFLTDSGRIFDYPRYLESKHIVGVGKSVHIDLVEKGKFSLSRIAAIVRFHIADILAQNVSFPIDGVIAGMTVGYQGALPDTLQDLFRNTGVLHVLVLSGYNITLLAGFLGLLLRRLPFRLRTVLIICSIILLVVVSGSGIASVRAGIMGSIALFAGLTLQTYQPLRALTLSYLFFFFLSPETIFSDPGFHLSFLATAYMVLMLPKVEKMFSFLPKTKGINIRELLMLALTIPLFMLPYFMYFSGNFPLASPIANIVLALVTPILMVLGILVIAFSWLGPIAHILGVLAAALGSGTIATLELFARLPQWNTPALSWWGVALFYMFLFFTLFRSEITSYLSQLRSSLLPASNSFD